MNYNSYKKSILTRYIWLGIAVFFVVFCSCPVKKYISLQLYKHTALADNSKGDHFSKTEVKDCTIAERDDNAGHINMVVFQFPERHPVEFNYFVPSLLPLLSFYYREEQDYHINVPHVIGAVPIGIPLYLHIRHLQV